MRAAYVFEPGYGCTPPGGIKGFTTLFKTAVNLNYSNEFSNIDALILWGGGDIATSLYKEQPFINRGQTAFPSNRDLIEWHMLKEAYERGVPVIGVCRGAQIMCAFAGGKLAQHIDGHNGSPHDVTTYDGKEFDKVLSYHHQMMYPYDVEHKVLAVTKNNLSKVYVGLKEEEADPFHKSARLEPEVVYFPQIKGIGIQSHPEWADGTDFVKWCNDKIVQYLYTK